jgi:hypothetical protein
MTADDRVIELIVSGYSVQQIVAELTIKRSEYYRVLERLTNSGLLTELGALPKGADSETYPTQESIDLFERMSVESGWNSQHTTSVTKLHTRYGGLPPASDDRYSRAKWSGHTVRRVDLKVDTDYSIMVVGLLVPRQDKQSWQRSVPQYRAIHVTDSYGNWTATWIAEREKIVTADRVAEHLSSGFSMATLSALVICIAWVCESRALLVRSMEGSE